MKRIAVALMMVVFMALALTGCMPMGGADGGEDSSGGLLGILPLILIIVVFYFILIRPQNKKNKQVAQMRDSIKRGDWVTSIGGLKGRVVRVKGRGFRRYAVDSGVERGGGTRQGRDVRAVPLVLRRPARDRRLDDEV